MPIKKLLRQEQQMMTSIMNGFHAQPFTILQVTIQNERSKLWRQQAFKMKLVNDEKSNII